MTVEGRARLPDGLDDAGDGLAGRLQRLPAGFTAQKLDDVTVAGADVHRGQQRAGQRRLADHDREEQENGLIRAGGERGQPAVEDTDPDQPTQVDQFPGGAGVASSGPTRGSRRVRRR
jgi:hypothetical protein